MISILSPHLRMQFSWSGKSVIRRGVAWREIRRLGMLKRSSSPSLILRKRWAFNKECPEQFKGSFMDKDMYWSVPSGFVHPLMCVRLCLRLFPTSLGLHEQPPCSVFLCMMCTLIDIVSFHIIYLFSCLIIIFLCTTFVYHLWCNIH